MQEERDGVAVGDGQVGEEGVEELGAALGREVVGEIGVEGYRQRVGAGI